MIEGEKAGGAPRTIEDIMRDPQEAADSFLAYRRERSRTIHETVLVPYYEGRLSMQEVQDALHLSGEQTRVVQYMLESFRQPKSPDKLKRKDGSHIAVHSLQLFVSALEFFGIADEDVLETVLLHDIIEDTRMTADDVAQALGHERAERVLAMTERRDEAKKEDSLSRKRGIVAFAGQIRRAGRAAATAELLDRIDDISDLGYLVNKVREPAAVEVRDNVRDALIAKFGTCSYTVRSVEQTGDPRATGLAAFFRALMERQRTLLEASGIFIAADAIQREADTYESRKKEIMSPEEWMRSKQAAMERKARRKNRQEIHEVSGVKRLRVKGCDIVWHIENVPPYGDTKIEQKHINIFGKKSGELAWVLAHELAHALEPKEKKVRGKHTAEVVLTQRGTNRATRKWEAMYPEGLVEFDDLQSGARSFSSGKLVYPPMTPEEFHASRRSKHYLHLACGALGISLETALRADPPEFLTRVWDRGYFYQWRAQVEQRRKLLNKKEQRRASAKVRLKKQKLRGD